MMVFVGIVLAYGSTVVPMVKNVFCFIGVTAWCRQKSWERSDSPIRIETQSQAEVQSGGGGLKNFGSVAGGDVVSTALVVIVTEVPITPVPDIAIKTEDLEMPVQIITAIVPTSQPLPEIPIPNTPVVPVPTAQPTAAPLVDGYDIEGFTSMCLAMGSGYVAERQGDIWVCHCPGCP